MKRSLVVISLIIIAAVVLSACSQTPTEDPNVEITRIASTVQAQLTQIYLLTPSATPTLEPTATPTMIPATDTPAGPTETATGTPYPTYAPGATAGDNSKFTADVTIPDGTAVKAGEVFTKTWRLTNTGTTTWSTDYKLVYVDGNATGQNGALSVNLPNAVKPGETVDISVNFTAPSASGTYTSYWRLFSANGMLFGETCSVKFVVG
ncbi:MAG: hypothetical protein GYA58_15675 [Anaerolineaceae bacterium]|nr:hypothetical protein [Anaerolineaceae bacterium]